MPQAQHVLGRHPRRMLVVEDDPAIGAAERRLTSMIGTRVSANSSWASSPAATPRRARVHDAAAQQPQVALAEVPVVRGHRQQQVALGRDLLRAGHDGHHSGLPSGTSSPSAPALARARPRAWKFGR